MTKEEQLRGLMEQFYCVVNRINQLRSVPIRLEGCEPLNTASIHFIETIGSYESINMTEISEKLGVTKGAVSQMAAKLVSKGLVSKTKPPHSEKDVFLSLTEDGRRIFEEHGRLHGELYAELSWMLDEFSESDLKRVTAFFQKVKQYMEEYAHSVI